MKKALILLIYFISGTSLNAQNLDSLWNVWQNQDLADTARLEAIGKLAFPGMVFSNPDSAFKLAEMQYTFAKKIGNKKYMANALNIQGVSFGMKGNNPRALDYFLQVKKIREEIGDKEGLSNLLNNIARVYDSNHEYNKSLAIYIESLDLLEEIGNEEGKLNSLINLGFNYASRREIDSALRALQDAYKIAIKYDNQRGIFDAMAGIGYCYELTNDLDTALEYYLKSLALSKKVGPESSIVQMLYSVGSLYQRLNNSKQAIDYCKEALKRAKRVTSLIPQKKACLCLYNAYRDLDKYQTALKYHEEVLRLNDSIFNNENTKEVTRLEMQYEFDKQQAAEKAEQDKKDALAAAKLHRQEIIRNTLIVGLLITLFFATLLFKQRNKIIYQKEQVETAHEETQKQKEAVEIAHQEIRDSINYAKRIQNAILPPKKLIKEILPENFILYKPKDVVAGDFYWLEQKDGKILFAAADCTGHGVPGAMVSVVCNNGLNRSVREYDLTEPGEILDKTQEIVIQEFEKSEEEVKDGMDISLCTLNTKTMSLQWSGANNPIWIINKNRTSWPESSVLFNNMEGGTEIKPNRQAIGKVDDPQPFTTHQIELQKGDTIYLFTDGFQDQFGGEKGKKFKPANFKKLLLSIQSEEMDKQKEIIDLAFEEWRGNLEQIDDVCVIGVRI